MGLGRVKGREGSASDGAGFAVTDRRTFERRVGDCSIEIEFLPERATACIAAIKVEGVE
jgi:hypothetical protein